MVKVCAPYDFAVNNSKEIVVSSPLDDFFVSGDGNIERSHVSREQVGPLSLSNLSMLLVE